MLRLLAVTAHPDDESGAFGGTLALYSRRGVHNAVTCLTPGQAATHRGDARSDEELASIRRQEMARACALLGVHEVEVLDFHDGQLDKTDFAEMAAIISLRVRSLRPHVIVTFGADGITGHADHTMASLVATAAFHWAARPERFPERLQGVSTWKAQKLYYATSTTFLPDRQEVLLAPWTAEIDITGFVDTKLAAFKAHTTQTPLFELFSGSVERNGPRELFHLAAKSDPGPASLETDLFTGVIEEPLDQERFLGYQH